MPTIQCKDFPAILPVSFVLAPDGVVVQIQKLRNPGATLPVIKQQDRVRPPGNPVIFTLTPNASFQLATLCC